MKMNEKTVCGNRGVKEIVEGVNLKESRQRAHGVASTSFSLHRRN